MRAMGAFLDGMSRTIVLHPTPPEEAMRRAWESVGDDLWWAIGEFNTENNLKLEKDQLELPLANKPSR